MACAVSIFQKVLVSPIQRKEHKSRCILYSGQVRDLAPNFRDLSQNEKVSEIKPPLEWSDVMQWEVVEFKSVILQIGFLCKFRIANGAFEGFFACVQQHVTFQIARIGEAFLAHFAMYWFIHQYLLSSIKKVF